jgi:hypothetical protein
MMKKAFLLLLILGWTLYGQEGNPTPPGTDTADSTTEVSDTQVTGTNSPASLGSPDESPQDPASQLSFFQRMNLQDIQTMDYYALRQDLQRNGLDVTGNLETLRTRLLEFYQLPIPQETQSSERTITIKSASETSYFVDENIDEGYVRFTGGVILSLLDRSQDVTHEIAADEILFNRDQDLVTASGHVRYKMIKPDSQEEFTGSSLTFNISNWSGAFFQGISKRDRDIEGQGLEFSFSGEVIRRNRDDVIILYDGMITSSVLPDPYYSIRAEKIWVYAPGEWGLQNASLHVGRVPVFYFPFFYQPGDEIFFNPVLSISPDDRRGTYVQTTTYLYGEKENASSPLSFLQIAEGDSQGIPKEVRGLYLVEVAQDKSSEQPADDPSKDWMWKVAFDSYSKLGFYLGTEFNLRNFLGFSTFEGLMGLGLTWQQFSTGLNFNPSLDGTLFPWEESVLETPKLFGTFIPFRYGWQGNFKYQGISLDAEFYSDQYFEADFLSRDENFSPFFLLGFGDPAAQSSRGTPKSSFNWVLNLDAPSISVTDFNPFLSRFSPRSIETSLAFASFDWIDPETDLDDEETFNNFFGLQTVNWLSTSFGLGGNFIGRPQPPAAPASTGIELISPWESEEKEESPPQEDSEIVLDPLFPNIPVSTTVQGLSFSFPWSLEISEIKISSDNTTTGINTPEELVFDPQQTNFNLGYSGSFTPNLNYSSGLINTTFTTSYSGKYYSHLYIEDALLTQSVGDALAGNRNFGLDQRISLSIKPLWMLVYLSSSTVTYNLDFDVADYSESFNFADKTYTQNWEFSDWSDQRISRHNLEMNLAFTPFLLNPQLLKLTASYSGTLSPRPLSNTISSTLDSAFMGAKAQVRFNLKSDENQDWEPSDITGFVGYDWENWLSYRTDYTYSIEENTLEALNSSLRFDQFNLRFNVNLVDQYEFNEGNGVWEIQTSSPKVFVPNLLNISYTFKETTWQFWRNRFELKFNSFIGYNLDPQRYTNNSLDFNYGLTFDFMDQASLTLKAEAENNAMFLYSEAWVGELLVGGEQFVLNPWEDLAKSFFFWDETARRESNFNLNSFSADFTQSFPDWDLTIAYNGLVIPVDGQFRYQQTLKFEILWKPIPEIRTSTDYTEQTNTLEIKTDSDS